MPLEPVVFRFAKPQQSELFSVLKHQSTPDGWRPDEPPDLQAMGIREVAVDLETTGLRWFAGDRPVGVAVAWLQGDELVSRYLPFGHSGGNLDEEAVRRWAREQLRGLRVVNLNTKFDAHFMREWGADLATLAGSLGDVAHYAALLDDHRGEGWRRPEKPFSLEALAQDYVGEGKVPGLDKTRMADYHASEVTAYARQDTALVIRILQAMRPMLEREELVRVAALEDAVLPAVVEMERNAARIDVEKLHLWDKQSKAELDKARVRLANAVGWNVNPDSPEHMAKLFRQLGLQSDRVTDTGRESFAASVLEQYKDNPTITQVIRVSHLADLRSKFIAPYVEAVGADGLLRFEFHQLKGDQYGTVSGRFSSTKPAGAKKGANVQQVFAVDNQLRMHCDGCASDPEWGKRKDKLARHYQEHATEVYLLRELFIPDDGRELLATDAEQIEYRTFAHLTRSPRLIKAYADNPRVDFHEWTGDLVRKYRPDFERKRLKIVNFSNLFGAGVGKQAEMLGISEEEGAELQRVYFQAFPEAKALMNLAMRTAKERGYIRTILGRRARFPGERRLHAALNRAVSGSAADLNKLKLVALHRDRKELDLKLRMTVHDEFVGDVAPGGRDAVAAAMDRQEFPLLVPILWDTRVARNWAEAK